MRPVIDYPALAQAIQLYKNHGWHLIEVPWMVSRDSCFATVSDPERVMQVGDQYLVGSAEQGFLDLDLSPGSYMAVSPCFRDEPETDISFKTFLKLELHRTDDVSDRALMYMIGCAISVMSDLGANTGLIETEEGWDLMQNCIELGSYGRRTHGGRTWLYGTGLALPRFHLAIA